MSPNEQATDPKKHTLVRITYNLSSPALSPANSDRRHRSLLRDKRGELGLNDTGKNVKSKDLTLLLREMVMVYHQQ